MEGNEDNTVLPDDRWIAKMNIFYLLGKSRQNKIRLVARPDKTKDVTHSR